MKWIASVTVALFTLASPALADRKGEALFQAWIARIGEIQPIVAETTTTYTYGKHVAFVKCKYVLTANNQSVISGVLRGDPMVSDVCTDLSDNLNPLPYGPNGSKSLPMAADIRYLGKERVAGAEYDVVQVYEPLTFHLLPATHIFDSSRRKADGAIALKWYFDADGMVRRITFATASAPAPTAAGDPAGAMPQSKEATTTLTATMVVDTLRKVRTLPPRPTLHDPLFSVSAVRPGNVQGFAFSPDGKLLAIGGRDKLQVIATNSGQPAFMLDNAGPAILVDFSADGSSLAFSNNNGFKVVSTRDGHLINSIVTEKKYYESIRMSPDGAYVAVTGGPDIGIWNVKSGKQERTVDGSGDAEEAMFTPDGQRLVTVSNAAINIRDTRTWEIVERLPMEIAGFQMLAISPDSKTIAVVSADNTVLLWDASSARRIRELKGAAGRIWFITFSNDGKSLYAGDRDEREDLPTRVPGVTGWDVSTGAVIADYDAWSSNMTFGPVHAVISPDGRSAAFRDTVMSQELVDGKLQLSHNSVIRVFALTRKHSN